MDYKSTIYKDCLKIAEELIWEDYIRKEFPLHTREFVDMEQIRDVVMEQYSELEKMNLGQNLLQAEIEKNNYKNEMSRQIDLEWLEAFTEWRDIYNERLLAKSRVL